MVKIARLLVLVLVSAVLMTVLDLLWLGVVARSLYDAALGALRRPTILWPAAALFYVFYISLIVGLVILPARDVKDAGRRGVILGLAAYGTYELTNWAVLTGWPAILVPVDLAWGMLLTGVTGAVGRGIWQRLG
jgi:uncharacterized membrane protein